MKEVAMLVIVSDLHLNDHTTGSPLDAGAFEIFAERLHETAFRASWRADGRYRPIEQIEIVLLGDILDLVRTTEWLRTNQRPWDNPDAPETADAVGRIVDHVLQRNQAACRILSSLSTEAVLQLPPPTQAGEPAMNAEGLPIAVRTFYMVGNHDWPLHLPGPRYDMIRHKVAHQLGLANIHNAPFPHDPYESDELLAVLRRHRVVARHGDIFDPINFSEDRDVASLGDAIVIDLLTRFTVAVQQQLSNDLPPAVLHGIKQLDCIRPVLLAPVWLEGLLARSAVRTAIRKEIKRTWDSLADELLQLPIVREHDAWSPFEIVDGMDLALKFSKRLSIGWAGKITNWLQTLRGSQGESYYQHAISEADFRNRRARNIVYGHTHLAESIPLDASYADGYVLNQMYFNSGTWRRVLQQTRWTSSEYEFIPTECLSMLSFYHGDERGGRPYETWSGTLATAGEVATHRVDSGRSSHAAEQSIPASKVPLRAPHFRRSPTHTRSTSGGSY
jgi:UDP-2,3-diacylglucosamine pyrophosphatase LpxH